MKTYIPKQPKQVRERIEAKLDVRLVERLERYCQYLESDRDYVVSQALELIFRKDRGFANWLAGQGATSSGRTFASNSGITSGRARREHSVVPVTASSGDQPTPTDLGVSARRA